MQPQAGYAAKLLSQRQALPSRGWLMDAAWLGGLSAAAGAAWQLLAAHPAARLALVSYIATEGLFYLYGKLRSVNRLAMHAPAALRPPWCACVLQACTAPPEPPPPLSPQVPPPQPALRRRPRHHPPGHPL